MKDKSRIENLIDKLEAEKNLSDEEFLELFHADSEGLEILSRRAEKVAKENFGNGVYKRGLIEISNYCRNDCYYCGIRRSNRNLERYRLSDEEIFESCDIGYEMGFRTFVLQGGEDLGYSVERIENIVGRIKDKHPECRVTLSLGEADCDAYKRWYDAGADRYLLRHESSNAEHYSKLHPEELVHKHRMDCLKALKQIGYQIGAGFMVGSPYQTEADLIGELRFLKGFNPHMIGIGPFIPQEDTPFGEYAGGSEEMTLILISIIRLMMPKVLLPSTTALDTISDRGTERGILAGANVVMPNLTPKTVRKHYAIYKNKKNLDNEIVEVYKRITKRIEDIGYVLLDEKGDYSGWEKKNV